MEKKQTNKPTGSEMLKMTFQELPQTDENNVIIWMPDTAGEQLTGQVDEIKHHIGQFDQTVYFIRDTDENMRSVYGNTTLDQAMAQIHEGDIVQIVFEGIRVSKAGHQYKLFKVLKAIPDRE